jgi:hypothetical protein
MPTFSKMFFSSLREVVSLGIFPKYRKLPDRLSPAHLHSGLVKGSYREVAEMRRFIVVLLLVVACLAIFATATNAGDLVWTGEGWMWIADPDRDFGEYVGTKKPKIAPPGYDLWGNWTWQFMGNGVWQWVQIQ